MNIEVTSKVGDLRYVKRVRSLRARRSILHGIVEAVNLRVPRHPEIRPRDGEPKTAPDVAIENPQLSIGFSTKEKQLSQLIGRECNAELRCFEPGFEPAARIELKNRALRRTRRADVMGQGGRRVRHHAASAL